MIAVKGHILLQRWLQGTRAAQSEGPRRGHFPAHTAAIGSSALPRKPLTTAVPPAEDQRFHTPVQNPFCSEVHPPACCKANPTGWSWLDPCYEQPRAGLTASCQHRSLDPLHSQTPEVCPKPEAASVPMSQRTEMELEPSRWRIRSSRPWCLPLPLP